MVVIALSGWKGAGKDTVADYLVRKYGCIKVSFADKLKDLVAKLYGVPRDYFDDPQYKEAALLQLPVQLETLAELTTNMPEVVKQFKSRGTPCWTPRALCIFVGNKMRLIDPECWIKAALADLEPKLNNYVTTLAVKITLLRFVCDGTRLFTRPGRRLVQLLRRIPQSIL
jgi:hypothetical protein